MSSRFADLSTMRTRSPIYHDEPSPKRPPPSPSNKAPPPKKLDAKSRAMSEELSKVQAVITSSSESLAESCPDKSSGNRVIVDNEVFQQILELDEGDDDREFSRNMVDEYLAQASETIKSMDASFAKHASSTKHEELTQLGKYGHFLKGSSAALGAVQVQEICEKIQHLGNRIDLDKEPEVMISVDDAFAKIKPLLARLKGERDAADKCLNKLLDNLGATRRSSDV